ncbi:hypothetical protein CSA56_02855 [candidate division KSB3 bacterium]|uniref:Glycosyltransferase family 9 protein n=1 Tax=candidate division KSB3 bacterium TaxID=2044937 RepID=A0A2G6KJG8_9BACT|nr:MAG: hypothetical protein CSA56_02855 [candidate division KSB3 bacterium]
MDYPVPARNILVIQLRQVGDVLLTTPAVKVLRDHYPHCRISYLTETGPAMLLEGNPHIDRVFLRNRHNSLWQDVDLIRRLRAEKFDLVIDFFCNPRSAWMSFLTGAPHRIAAYHAGRSWWYSYTPSIDTEHGYAAAHNLALLREIGVGGGLVPPVIRIPDKARQYIDDFLSRNMVQCATQTPMVTIDMTSRRQAKRWIPERYVQLADLLVKKWKARTIFIWGPGEREMVENVLKQGQQQHLLACDTNLMQLAALIARSDLHIGNCSAPRHLAVAVDTPSLTVMGPTSPESWTYPDPKHRVARGAVNCLECQKRECDTHICMKALTVEQLAETAGNMLRNAVSV